MDIALLIARLFFGLGLAAHGAQKLLGWFGGSGLNKTGEFFVKLGWNQGRFFASAASVSEVVGGLLLALGFLGPLGPAIIVIVLTTAALTVHLHNGFFAGKNGVELPLLYVMGALVFMFTGPGMWSLDYAFGLQWLSNDRYAWLALAAALVIALANVALRRPPRPAGA
jgi:putative oxidoreductase